MPEVVDLACVTGRFQPVHGQHLELFEIALQFSEHLVVAVTNPDSRSLFQSTSSTHRHREQDNPFTYFERVALLRAALAERGLLEKTTILPFDLGAPEQWAEYVPLTARQYVRIYSAWERDKAELLRAAGYAVVALDGDVAGRLSSSEIRARMATGGDWQSLVPAATVAPLLGHPLAGPHETREAQA